MKKKAFCVSMAIFVSATISWATAANLLQNPSFEFHSFINHRQGVARDFDSGYVAFWNSDAYDDVRVVRESHIEDIAGEAILPVHSVHNLVAIKPGKRFWQFCTLPEAGLSHGDCIILTAGGYQSESNALSASIRLMKLDSEDGQWSPKEFGQKDDRVFPKHSRGELIVAKSYETHLAQTGTVALAITNAEITGHFQAGKESHSSDVNTIGIEVMFVNNGRQDVWVYAPTLVATGSTLSSGAIAARPMIPYYRYLPRTIQKLWKGEALHIIVMGSSIDRGSANPPLYCYDEDPAAATFKQPRPTNPDRSFEADKVNRPDLADYVGWWQHYWSYAGRLRLELMRKFNLPANKFLLNFMACDGSSVGTAHSGLAEYCALAVPPDPGLNGYPAGKTWHELHPDLFTRKEGPGPDLVIFGSGANRKVDTPDEVAVFEGAIRWIQRHYPHCEFLFCQFQNRGRYTPNGGDLKALALRYQIPAIDVGKALDDTARWCNPYALIPIDGHPQAAAHYLWFKQIEKAFECWDPTEPGQLQAYLPERLHPNSYAWEGEMATFTNQNPRINDGTRLILEDTVVNGWATASSNRNAWIDGKQFGCANYLERNTRNSSFTVGRLALGDRHILETTGNDAKIIAVDCKICPNRVFFGMDSDLWRKSGLSVENFASEWGAPYGDRQIKLIPGQGLEIDVAGSDLAVAYVDRPDGGTLRVAVDGAEKRLIPTDQPFITTATNKCFLENRKGVLGLGYGLHSIRLEAVDKPVYVLGLFTYDSRSNHQAERRLRGFAAPGDKIGFSAPFQCRPLVFCQPPLAIRAADIQADGALFGGTGPGLYEIVGE